ncbi:MAG: hypothetical protein ACLUDU_02380 [Butyricimonas faecihominis]
MIGLLATLRFLTNPENIFPGTNSQKNGGQAALTGALTTARAALFEAGDARLRLNGKRSMKLRTIFSMAFVMISSMGVVCPPEMYYIKAECLARKGGQDNLTMPWRR